ncbi:MAG: hypothetical protein NC341_02060 [Blautia sp.]|nr:hypothetical protein [Blautia sp.]MCM1200402.1 hypothetical protein [Bacteroides fragilis]
MKEINYWDRFLMTGSVSDFLSYKNAVRDREKDKEEEFVAKDRSGGQSHAGVYRDYGNGHKGGADWRI